MGESPNTGRRRSVAPSAAILMEAPRGAKLPGPVAGPLADLAPGPEEVAVMFVEVLTLLAERARHHGLAEVGEFLEVAALAAEDAAGPAPRGGE